MVNRFRQRSFDEIKTRASQGVHIVMERLGLLHSARLPAVVRFITPAGQVSDSDLTPDHVSQILKPGHHFYRSVQDVEGSTNTLRTRFPNEEHRIVTAADRICEGRFDLLGYKDLSFGGPIPNWHLDPISGKTSPLEHWSRINEVDATSTGDKKIVWELNRHQFFVVLGQAYALTGDERFAECFSRLLRSWMDANPPKLGVNWLSSLELAFRSISWIWAFHLFRNSPHFTPELLAGMTKFLFMFGRHIETYLSTYFSPNTHLTGEALGLYFLGSFLPEVSDAARWKSVGYKILIDSFEFQVRSDGTYCEQASHYLRYTIDFYCNLLLLRRQEGSAVEPELETNLHRLFDCLLHVTFPDGTTPNFGDDDGGRLHFLDDRAVTDFRPSLALGAVLLKRGDLKFAAGEPSAELVWLLGSEGLDEFDSIAPVAPSETVRAFSDGGVFAARSDWTERADSILIDCGPHGFLNGGHAHADVLSFVMAINGVPVFVDSGTYNYTSDLAERDRFRSSHAHNCLTVDERSSSMPAGPFSWKTTADGRLVEWRADGDGSAFLRGTHDGFADLGVRYERSIDIDFKDEIRVEDSVSASGTHLYEIHFILSPEFHAEIPDPSARLVIKTRSGGEAALQLDSSVSGAVIDGPRWRKEDWNVSAIYGQRTMSQKVVYSVEGSGSLQILTKIRRNRDI